MGAYNFKPQFEPAIMADLKRHTIRAKRKDGRRPKVGEVLSLYLGMMRKGACRLLKRRRCVKVQEIEIYERGDGTLGVIFDERVELQYSERNLFARSDGFSNWDVFCRYWIEDSEGRPVDFTGHLIHWESDTEAAKNPVPEPKRHRPATGSPRRANTRRARRNDGPEALRIGQPK